MSEIAAEYASALFDLAKEISSEKEFADALAAAKREVSPEYIRLLSSPNVSLREKESLIDAAFQKSFPEYAVFFLKLLCKNKRLHLLSNCADEYEKLYKKSLSHSSARIVSAVGLSDEEKTAIIEKLERITKTEVTAEYEIDKTILGGVIVYINDKIFDGSVRRKLQEVKDVIEK